MSIKSFVLFFPKPACLRLIAEEMANQSPTIVTPEQVRAYVSHLVEMAFRLDRYVVLRLDCETRPPIAYSKWAEEIFEVDDRGNAKTVKNRHAAGGLFNLVYEALKPDPADGKERPKLTLLPADKKSKEDS